MGETLKRELSFGDVPSDQPSSGGFIPDFIANHMNSRPTWASEFLQNLPAAFEGAGQAEQAPGSGEGGGLISGLGSALGNISKVNRQRAATEKEQQQQMLDNLFKQRQLEVSQGHLDVSREQLNQKVPKVTLADEAGQRGTLADALGLKGEERTRYVLTGQIAPEKPPKVETLSDFEAAFQRQYGRLPNVAELINFKRQSAATGASGDARADKSYALQSGRLDKLRDPISSQADRLQRLQLSIDQKTPQADSLIAPELLTAMAGGAGSGLRMNEAEISRIVGGRTKWEDLKAKANQWSRDPSKGLQITDDQREQIKSLVGEMNSRISKKLALIDSANEQLINTNDIKQHRQVVSNLHKSLSAVDAGGGGSSGTSGAGGIEIIRDANGRIIGIK